MEEEYGSDKDSSRGSSDASTSQQNEGSESNYETYSDEESEY